MKKEGSIHERISQLVDFFGDGKNTVFAKIVGESEANVRGYKIDVIPKHPFLEKIARNLDISPEWLLTGQGDMLKPGSVVQQGAHNTHVSGGVSGNSNRIGVHRSFDDEKMVRELREENKRLSELNHKLVDDNMKLVDRINALVDKLLKTE